MMDRKRTDFLIEVFIQHLISIKHDAGWHGDNLLSRLIDYKGFIPPPSTKASGEGKMIYETTFLRNEHPDLPDIQTAMRKLEQKNYKWYLAILSKHYYAPGTGYICPAKQRFVAFTDENRAGMVGQTYKQYKNNIMRAYEYLSEVLDIVELSKEFRKERAA